VSAIEPSARIISSATTSSGHNSGDKDLINGLINTVNKQKDLLKLTLKTPDPAPKPSPDPINDYSANGRFLALRQPYDITNMSPKEIGYLAGLYGLDREYKQYMGKTPDKRDDRMDDYGYGSEDIPDLSPDNEPNRAEIVPDVPVPAANVPAAPAAADVPDVPAADVPAAAADVDMPAEVPVAAPVAAPAPEKRKSTQRACIISTS